MNSSLVSVVMAAYNGEKFLDEQIETIINQTYKNIELVIVDDCSTDSTWEKLQHWQRAYPETIKIYRNKKNVGLHQNFALAIALASGEYIAITDQDDIWHLDKIEKLHHLLNLDSKTILVHHNDNDLRDGKVFHPKTEKYAIMPFEGDNPKPLLLMCRVAGHCMMFRKSLMPSILPIPAGIYYDWWILAVAVANGVVKYCDKVLVDHRLHPNSAYFANKDKQGKNEKIKETKKALMIFCNIDSFNNREKIFIKQYAERFNKHELKYNGRFDIGLFFFYLRFRRQFFPRIAAPNPIAKEILLIRLCRVYAKQ